jgi:hypothetical protein
MTYTPALLEYLRHLEVRYLEDVHRARATLLQAAPEIPDLGGQGDEDAQQCAQIDLSLAALCRCKVHEHLARAATAQQGCRAA